MAAELEHDERAQVGTGDGSTTMFTFQLRGPVVSGSVSIRAVTPDAVTRLAALSNGAKFELSCRDKWPGAMTGNVTNPSRSVIDYQTGLTHIEWEFPPLSGVLLICDWRRMTHRLRGSKVQVQLPDGDTEWVPLSELQKAIALE